MHKTPQLKDITTHSKAKQPIVFTSLLPPHIIFLFANCEDQTHDSPLSARFCEPPPPHLIFTPRIGA